MVVSVEEERQDSDGVLVVAGLDCGEAAVVERGEGY